MPFFLPKKPTWTSNSSSGSAPGSLKYVDGAFEGESLRRGEDKTGVDAGDARYLATFADLRALLARTDLGVRGMGGNDGDECEY